MSENSHVPHVSQPHNRLLAVSAALCGLAAVALGTFGAHGLQRVASLDLLPTWQTGVRYHMFHVLAALIAGFCGSGIVARRWAVFAGWLFVAGILFFSGSLYLLVLAPQGWLMMTAPVGGVLFLLGWASLTWALISNK